MAIVLDRCNEVKTHHFDFKEQLEKNKDGIRCVLDIDLMFHEYSKTMIGEFKLVPLDEFRCKRTIVGNRGTKVDIDAHFGLTKDDFIDMDFQEVELRREHYATIKGLLISNRNPYYDIVNALAKHFEFVGADNRNSFVLDESELDEIKLVPFKLRYSDNHFIVADVEDEMPTSEFDAIVDEMYCEDFAL
jgi:hypothetical protein